MTQLDFIVQDFEFESLPHFGREHVLARLSGGEAQRMGFPLFTPSMSSHSSDSPFMDAKAAATSVSILNPDLPAVPEEVRFVVTGQQPGLLTGPLYTFLKAVSAITLASRLSEQGDSPVLPLFWVASEDHDVLEVNRVFINGKSFVHPYEGELKRGMVPEVGEIPIHEAREPLLEYLRECLPMTEFTPWIMDAVASTDYSNYASAFEGLMRSLFDQHGLRFVSPKALRLMTAPVLAELVEKWSGVIAGFERGTEKIRGFGFEPPLENVGFFELREGRRVAVKVLEGNFLMGEGEYYSSAAADIIRSRPADFSPGAAFRPILQDAVLPVVATIGGPAELLYLWQINLLYDEVGVTPSLLIPRISATFVEAKIRKAVENANLSVSRIFDARALLEGSHAAGVEDPMIMEIESKARALMDDLDGIGGDVGPRWLMKGKEALSAQVDKIIRRLRKEKLAAQGLDQARLEKIMAAVLPRGKPQERGENAIHFLNRYGRDFVRLAIDRLDPLNKKHQVVFLGQSAKED